MTRTIRMKDITGLKANATTAPFVTTEPAKIGGVRGGGSTPPGDPPPVGGPGDLTPEQWRTVLTVDGSGTPDSTFNSDTDIQFIGAFRIGFRKNGEMDSPGSNVMESIAYRPPNGTNGPNGSMYYSAWGRVGEVQIPELRTDADHLLLNDAPDLQDMMNVINRLPGGNPNNNERNGWLKFEDNKLYFSTYAYYDGGANNTASMGVLTTPDDLDTGTYLGPIEAYNTDWGARYIIDIPQERQVDFGNKTHFCGVGAELAIVGRSSLGHSLIGLNLSDFEASTTSLDNIVWARYGGGTEIEGYSNTNGLVAEYYADLAWATTTFTQSDFYDGSESFIINSGGLDSRSLGAFANLPVGGTNRLTNFHQFPLPNGGLSYRTIGYNSMTGIGFIPPGTNTVCFLGGQAGSRYGQGYKGHYIEYGPEGRGAGHPGFHPISITDDDPFIWLMNLNDVSDRVNPNDTSYYRAGPWLDPAEVSRGKKIISGSFDASTNKLYLLTGGYFWNQFAPQHVVTVYQINSGAN